MNSVISIQKQFEQFFQSRDYFLHNPAKLIREEHHDTFFTVAGMQQFNDYFLNIKKSPYDKICTAQPCLRINGKHDDLGEIGKSPHHHTHFTMLGQFSFGALSPKDAIKDAWEFLMSLSIDKKYLYVTIHHTDLEAKNLWMEYIEEERIVVVYTDDNFWRAGALGPCGPCTEIFYDKKKRNTTIEPEELKKLIASGDELLEIWNIVFMKYNQTHNKQEPLDQICIDTGGGLERIASVVEGHFDNFKLQPILYIQQQLTDLGCKDEYAKKVIADHSIPIHELVKEGLTPGPVRAYYILRKLIRNCYLLFNKFNEIFQLDAVEAEISIFQPTLENSYNQLNQYKDKVTEEILVYLFHSQGLPLVVVYQKTEEYKLDKNKINQLIAQHSKNSNKIEFSVKSSTEILCYEYLENESEIVQLFSKNGEEKNSISGFFYMTVEASSFYGEGGGQSGDKGMAYLLDGSSQFKISNCTRQVINKEYTLMHHCHSNKEVKIGDKIKLKVNEEFRDANTRAHSATHLISEQIIKDFDRNIIGSHVKDDEFTIDYNGNRFTVEEVISMLGKANSAVIANQERKLSIKKCKEATDALGREGKHPDQLVRVVSLDFSIQLCGGTHVNRLGSIGSIFLLANNGMGKNKHRLRMICGNKSINYFLKLLETNHSTTEPVNQKSSSASSEVVLEKKEPYPVIVYKSNNTEKIYRLSKAQEGLSVLISYSKSKIKAIITHCPIELQPILESVGCKGIMRDKDYHCSNKSLTYTDLINTISKFINGTSK